MPISGPDGDSDVIEKACVESEAVIVAFDKEQVLPEAALNVFVRKRGAFELHCFPPQPPRL